MCGRRSERGNGTVIPARNQDQSGRNGSVLVYVFKSRAHRDRVNAKVMKDPRMVKMMKSAPIQFDAKRMIYGGFTTIVEG
jgi:uncharacterized protein YbaA (DUF1428 family)